MTTTELIITLMSLGSAILLLACIALIISLIIVIKQMKKLKKDFDLVNALPITPPTYRSVPVQTRRLCYAQKVVLPSTADPEYRQACLDQAKEATCFSLSKELLPFIDFQLEENREYEPAQLYQYYILHSTVYLIPPESAKPFGYHININHT